MGDPSFSLLFDGWPIPFLEFYIFWTPLITLQFKYPEPDSMTPSYFGQTSAIIFQFVPFQGLAP